MKLLIDPLLDAHNLQEPNITRTRPESQPVQGMLELFRIADRLTEFRRYGMPLSGMSWICRREK
jgi:hypothetical protein